MFSKLRTVIYNTPQLDEAKKWYSAILGRQPYFDMPFYVGFDINGFELGLDPDSNNIIKGNNSVAYWSVTNIEAVLNKLEMSGADIVEAAHSVGENIQVAKVVDPFGNTIGLIEEK